MVAALIALLATMAMQIGLVVLVLIHGWGLEPQSWWWIVGAGVFGRLLLDAVSTKVRAEFAKAVFQREGAPVSKA